MVALLATQAALIGDLAGHMGPVTYVHQQTPCHAACRHIGRLSWGYLVDVRRKP